MNVIAGTVDAMPKIAIKCMGGKKRVNV